MKNSQFNKLLGQSDMEVSKFKYHSMEIELYLILWLNVYNLIRNLDQHLKI